MQAVKVRVLSRLPLLIMKVTVENKKGLEKDIKVFIDKKTISGYLDVKYEEIRKDVVVKGFRPGKVPTEILKRQFGKAVYGEVIDKVLKDTTTKALEDNKIKPAGQPKIDLKSFGEGKDLEYTISVTDITYSRSLPSPNDLRSIFGCPAGLILLSSRAFVVVSFRTLSITSPYTALPNCLFKISVGTFPGLNPLRTTSFLISSYFASK